jgi:hypothetical protein
MVMEITTTHFLLPGKKHQRIKGTSINSFWNTNTGIFFRYKAPKTPACEAGSPDGYRDEYFGNLPLPVGRRSSWEKAQVGKQNGVIRGALKRFTTGKE